MRHALVLACCGVLALGSGCGSEQGPFRELTEGFGARLDEERIFARITQETLEVTLPLTRVGAEAAVSGEAFVELVKLGEGGGVLGKGSAGFILGAAGTKVRVALKAPVIAGLLRTGTSIQRSSDLGGYTIHYRVGLPGGSLRGRRSLYMAVERSGVAVIGNNRFVAGVEGVVRVLSMTSAGKALPGVPVRVSLNRDGGARELVNAKTDQRGELAVRFRPTADEAGSARLQVQTGTVDKSFLIWIEATRSQLLLTTDKPLYQPGQTVHMRALAMRQPQMVPLDDRDLRFEIIGPKGTKLLAKPTLTDAHGIASHRFALPKVLGLGRYTLRATVGDFSRERSFTVERYVLPKFKVRVVTDAAFYPPSAKVTGWVQVDYLFGKPVKQATVRLRAMASQPRNKMLWEVVGKTNAQGRFDFEGEAPAYGAQLSLQAEVEDSAGAVVKAATSVVLSGQTAKLQLLAERSAHVLGQENRYFVLVTTPAGAPRGGKVQVALRDAKPGSAPLEVEVPASGIARFTLPAAETCPGALQAKLESNEAGLVVRCEQVGGLRVDTDKAIYAPGEVAKISLTAPADVELVMLEVLRQNTSLQSVPVTLVEGVGALDLPLGPDLARTLTVRAYSLVGLQQLKDQRLIHVVAADQLQVAVTTDKASYRPAETAKITLQLRDAAGKPAPGALGVQVVDEALFALTDVKPGIERKTFHLDQELVDAGQGSTLLDPGVLSSTTPSAADQLAARALFAASGQQTSSPIHFRSFNADLQGARAASKRGLSVLMARLKGDLGRQITSGVDQAAIRAWVATWLAARQPDDFGQPLQLGQVKLSGSAHVSVTLRSAGMDERSGTADDLSATTIASLLVLRKDAGASADAHLSADGVCLPEASAPKKDVLVSPPRDSASLDHFVWPDIGQPSPDGGPSGKPDAGIDAGTVPAVVTRERFPETLYVDPALITDSEGKATIDLALADSITSWRLTSIAHTAKGQLGSAATALKVFQPFFVDVLLPTHLLQGDIVEVPVAVYNYLATTQTVTVDLTSAPWFELLDQASKQIAVPASSVGSVSFKLRAKQNGRFSLSATGRSASDVDAVKRSIRVLPDGLRKEIVRSGVLKPGVTTETLTIPQSAVDGANELYVKVYPGRLAEVVAGFDSMLAVPHDCFEQNSSATYPNVMVLRYLEATGQVSETFKTQALVEIGEGYVQLAGYEVGAGGFSLWGKAPADLVVTAYGLMLFAEMAKVHYVDPKLIKRMQTWLLAQQAPDGSFAPLLPPNYYGITGNAVTDELRTTAYVTWALAQSGLTGSAPLSKAAHLLRLKAPKESDPYTLALAANALLTISPKDPEGLAIVSTLKSLGKVDGDALRWDGSGSSLTYGHGASLSMETTALVAGALLLADDQGPEAGKALRYLTQRKSALGGYGTTQATVLTLRALILAASKKQPAFAEGSLEVRHNGLSQGSSAVTVQTADVMRLFDLKQAVIEGQNTVDVVFTGKGELAYQVVAVYYEPHGSTPPPTPPPFTFTVSYDKQTLALSEQIVVSATLTNSSGGTIPTTMMRIGLPPGFKVDLTQLLALPEVKNAELAAPYVVLYLGNLPAKTPQSVSFTITPTMAATGRAPASSAYPYYTPEYQRVVQTPLVNVTP
jgi:uncharacterized protein YfaS (alpha-2-macroglobulin family)